MHENLAVFWKTTVLKGRVRWRSGKINRAVISVILTCLTFCTPSCLIAPLPVTNWRSLSWKSRPRTAPWKFSEWIYRRLIRIISRTRSRVTQQSPFSFCKQFWNIPTSLWFSRNPLRERPKHLHLNNTLPSENFNWNSSAPFGFLTSFWPEVSLKCDN